MFGGVFFFVQMLLNNYKPQSHRYIFNKIGDCFTKNRQIGLSVAYKKYFKMRVLIENYYWKAQSKNIADQRADEFVEKSVLVVMMIRSRKEKKI